MSKMDLTDLSRNYFGGLSSSQASSYLSGDPVAFAAKLCGTFLVQGPENPDGSTNLYAPDGSLAAVIDANGNLFVRDGDRVLIYSAKPEEKDQNAVKAGNASRKEVCEQEVFGSHLLTEEVCIPEPASPSPEKQTCEVDVFTVVDEPQCIPPEPDLSTQNSAINLFGSCDDLLDRMLGTCAPDEYSAIDDPSVEEPEQPPKREVDPVIVAPEPEPKSKPAKADKDDDAGVAHSAKIATPAGEKVEDVETTGYGESESSSEDYSGFKMTFEHGSTEESSESYASASSGAEQTPSTQNSVGDLKPAFYIHSFASSAASGPVDFASAAFDLIPTQAVVGGILSTSFAVEFIKGAIHLNPGAAYFENAKHLSQAQLSALRRILHSQGPDSGSEKVLPEVVGVRSNHVAKRGILSRGMLPIGFDSLNDSGFSPLPSFLSARRAFLGRSKGGNAGISALGFACAIAEDSPASIAEATRGLGGMPHTMLSSGVLSAIFTAASDAERKLHTVADVSHEGHSHSDGGDEGGGGNRDQEEDYDDEFFDQFASEDIPAEIV
ncbi:MAG TPA: hypothetical protein PKU96_03805 [bacterium]|nr:hypothetical protein [bacterium]HQC50575.1 hypothetical protein [bacterium]